MMCTKFYRGSGFLKYGNAFEYRLVVTEPEPGRVLLEEDVSEDVVAKFPVGPLNGGDKYRVTIPNTARTSPGIRGVLEKLFTRGITRRIYREELRRMDDLVRRAD